MDFRLPTLGLVVLSGSIAFAQAPAAAESPSSEPAAVAVPTASSGAPPEPGASPPPPASEESPPETSAPPPPAAPVTDPAPAEPVATPPASDPARFGDHTSRAGVAPGLALAPGSFSLQDSPGWGGSLGAYGGLGALFGTDTRGSHSTAGGRLRVHYSYFTAGAYYEMSDRPNNVTETTDFWNAGGFAGIWLPYYNWVDFEVALRAGLRRYTDDDERFGPSGYERGGPALGLWLGVSDRSNGGQLGGRIGAALLATYDLSQSDEDWRTETGDEDDPLVRTGTDHVGGTSVALLLELALDAQP